MKLKFTDNREVDHGEIVGAEDNTLGEVLEWIKKNSKSKGTIEISDDDWNVIRIFDYATDRVLKQFYYDLPEYQLNSKVTSSACVRGKDWMCFTLSISEEESENE